MPTYRYDGPDERTYVGNGEPVVEVVPGVTLHDFDGDPWDVHWTLVEGDAPSVDITDLTADVSTDPAGEPATEKE